MLVGYQSRYLPRRKIKAAAAPGCRWQWKAVLEIRAWKSVWPQSPHFTRPVNSISVLNILNLIHFVMCHFQP